MDALHDFVFGRFDRDNNEQLNLTEFVAFAYIIFDEDVVYSNDDTLNITCPSAQALFNRSDVDVNEELNHSEFTLASDDMLLMIILGCEQKKQSSDDEDDDDDDDSTEQSILLGSKISLIAVLGLVTLATSVLPWGIKRLRLALDVMYVSSCFAAGVILGTGFSHTLPEAIESWDSYFEAAGPVGLANDDDVEYPFAELIAVLTLLILVFVEKYLVEKKGFGHHNHAKEINDDDDKEENIKGRKNPLDFQHRDHIHMLVMLPPEYEEKRKKNKKKDEERSKRRDNKENDDDAEMGIIGNNKQRRDNKFSHVYEDSSAALEKETDDDDEDIDRHKLAVDKERRAKSQDYETTDESENDGTMENHKGCSKKETEAAESGSEGTDERATAVKLEKRRGGRSQMGQAWMFFVALSLHSMFDGLGLGAAQSLDNFYGLLIAVLSHKLLDGFSLGVSVFFARFPWWQTAFSLVFCAAMTPLGIGIGMAVSSGYEGAGLHLTQAIILSLTAGSFYFISLMELLPAGLSDGRFVLLKISATFVGWGIMALIALWV